MFWGNTGLQEGERELERLSPGACLINWPDAKLRANEGHVLRLCSRGSSRQQEGTHEDHVRRCSAWRRIPRAHVTEKEGDRQSGRSEEEEESAGQTWDHLLRAPHLVLGSST